VLTPLSYLLNKQLLKVTKQRNAEIIIPPLLKYCVLFCSTANKHKSNERNGRWSYAKGRVTENKAVKN